VKRPLKLKTQTIQLFMPTCFVSNATHYLLIEDRVELLPGFKFTGKMVKKNKFTGKIGKKR
jgi:hypothetical protein